MTRVVTVLLTLASAGALSVAGSLAAATQKADGKFATAVVATGCFWCTESDFDKVPGVLATTSGYTGGKTANPTYEQVSGGGTGHIEALRIIYDPTKVNYAKLVQHALRTSDPTDGGGQFCDRGPQYRPAIFSATPAERAIANAAKAQAGRELGKPISTDILLRTRFYSAEGYHQDYYKKNPIRYRYYRLSYGRDARIKALWGSAAR